MPAINRTEWRWVLVWSLIILLVTTWPYLYGALLSTPDLQFSGFVVGLEDGHSYLSKMEQGRAGRWLFQLAYTPEPHQGEPFFLFYILLGRLAGLTPWSNAVIFHLSRLVTIPFGLLAFYFFAAYFSESLKVRRLALLIFGLTGGLGWLWVSFGGPAELGRMPVDLWVPDASFFLSALTFTHLPLAQGLLLLFSVAGLEFICRGRLGAGLTAAGCGLLVSLIHPHTLPVMGLILGLATVWQFYAQKRPLLAGLLRLGLITLPSLPYLLYAWLVFQRNPAFVAWREQSLTYSPAPLHYLLGFGLTFLLAVVGLALTWRPAELKFRFLHVWAISVPVLIYLPLALQRRFLDGYQAPLALLAAFGLAWLAGKIERRLWQSVLVVLTLLIMSLTNLLLVGGAMATMSQRPTPVFIATAHVEAATWLADRAGQNVVLASYEMGNYLPTVADVRTFGGHGPETARSAEKRAQVERFFNSATDDAWRKALLAEFGVDYLYYGPAERELGEFSPNTAPYLHQAYDNGPVKIYRVAIND